MRTPDGIPETRWVKSSYSGNGGGSCVEWAPDCIASVGTVPVRDSKDPEGPTLQFDLAAWRAFVSAVKTGELPTV